MYRECRREFVAGEAGRFERSARRLVARLRAGCSVEVHAAARQARKRALWHLRGAPIWAAVRRGPAEM